MNRFKAKNKRLFGKFKLLILLKKRRYLARARDSLSQDPELKLW